MLLCLTGSVLTVLIFKRSEMFYILKGDKKINCCRILDNPVSFPPKHYQGQTWAQKEPSGLRHKNKNAIKTNGDCAYATNALQSRGTAICTFRKVFIIM